MRKTLLTFFLLLSWIYLQPVFAQGQPFELTIVKTKPPGTAQDYRLAHPFEIFYGPDDYLYISEKIGRIIRVDPITGIRQIILDHTAGTYVTISRGSGGVATGIGQDGMMGLALHPDFGNSSGKDSIFVAYSYSPGNVRISRFKFNGGASPGLTNETVLIEGIPSGNDHSSGRLIIGEDELLYYSCGDMGNNQFGNRCNEIRSQKTFNCFRYQ